MVKVVTDSTAHLEPGVAEELGISVVPLNIHFGDETLRDGIDITTAEFFRRLNRSPEMPTSSPPSRSTFEKVYDELSKTTDEIISIHISSKLSQTCAVANAAAAPFLGRCSIAVIDSLTASLGLGILATAAAKAAAQGKSLDEVIHLLRGMIPHIYTIFLVENLNYLERGGRIGRAQAILGSMLGIKPLLTMEDGEIVPLEKVRTRSRAIDKLFEFVVEFPHIEQVAILQKSPVATEETLLLLERLELVLPETEFPTITYGPVLATHVGPKTKGIIVYEGVVKIGS
jgi:DegV family protein with EDD domain